MKEYDKKFFFGTKVENMDICEYINQINEITIYYHESSEKYKKKFYICCFGRIIASALIPVISLASKVDLSTIIVSILAALISISEGYINVTRAYEKWTNYRAICNALWIESRQFAMRSGDYQDEESRIKQFVQNCESMFTKEANDWKIYIERAKEMK